ncbi:MULTISPECIES: hypothetical protein [Gammaproteobacteria]|uniref:hypothetical protein n=1 Tax=Gammaproteobacteria TaxID=1236 RepID=UPI00107D93E0|nr:MULTISPECIES: hypothetical protein [Gammaproteobacteria]EAB9607384.1 hypothetical protein [Salmonella enterica subsp. enterica serovar Infantis]ECU8224377.1 hypothetical protein [Salmonella enterica subsp. enterica serovar Thompson]EFB1672092.1 hypothetical protein [Escherichia coli]EFF6323015.1 hypothetical protein [Escherichia coli]EHK7495329.1 hypothetical protein [Escherichia coli]
MRQLIAILGVTILAGCASGTPEQNTQSQTALAENDKLARVSMELSMSWGNMGRGGAALRQPGYIHVLGDGNIGVTMNTVQYDSASSNKTPAGFKQNGGVDEAINTFKSMNKGKSYSLYELSRWERYCNGGKGMDEHDWRFVVAEGTTNIPKDVITGCIPPTHTYQEYLDAWTYFCTSQTVTDADRRIVRESVRPYSVVNPCKALK